MSIDGRVIIAIILILVCVGAMFGFGYLYGISTCESETKMVNPKEEKSSLDEVKDKLVLIVNGSITEQFEENFDKCKKYNSNYKNLVNILLDFLCDEDGQFSKYFKFEHEFDDNFIEDPPFEMNQLSSLSDFGVTNDKIYSNNNKIIDKNRQFRNKINNVKNIDYYRLLKEYIFDPYESYGKIMLYLGLSKRVIELSETDIDNIASMIVGINIGFLILPMLKEADKVDYTVYFYDKETDQIHFHKDFVDIQERNAQFIETNNIENDVKILREEKIRVMFSEGDQPKLNEIKESITQNIKTKTNINEQDIRENINNIEMEALFTKIMSIFKNVFGDRKLTIVLKESIRSGALGGGEQYLIKGSKFNTSSYYNKIDSLNADKIPYCS